MHSVQDGDLTMPVPQPQIFAEWMTTVHQIRSEAGAMNDKAEGAKKEAMVLRKKFTWNDDVMDGLSRYLHKAQNSLEDFMSKCPDFAFDTAAVKRLHGLIPYFWNPKAAMVRTHCCGCMNSLSQPESRCQLTSISGMQNVTNDMDLRREVTKDGRAEEGQHDDAEDASGHSDTAAGGDQLDNAEDSTGNHRAWLSHLIEHGTFAVLLNRGTSANIARFGPRKVSPLGAPAFPDATAYRQAQDANSMYLDMACVLCMSRAKHISLMHV